MLRFKSPFFSEYGSVKQMSILMRLSLKLPGLRKSLQLYVNYVERHVIKITDYEATYCERVLREIICDLRRIIDYLFDALPNFYMQSFFLLMNI